ncbi:acyltransferase [Pseudomonas sp. BGI-2]|uniref:acyltransferase family protein n=1 Tax=Pseudomonas sp. BGI-2 TaxID=2528211 RepID=UPI002115149D|nr:acyltransferase family protein [Pseudomonas sp. BGI-2]
MAVIAVLLHHLNASLLPGGFVGVDILFVISGFLITFQVYSEVKRNAFSLKGFYQRRINRIVPALVTVLLATVIATGRRRTFPGSSPVDSPFRNWAWPRWRC